VIAPRITEVEERSRQLLDASFRQRAADGVFVVNHKHIARIRVQLPTSCPEGALFRTVALGLMRSGP
jgi:hypothetical protein